MENGELNKYEPVAEIINNKLVGIRMMGGEKQMFHSGAKSLQEKDLSLHLCKLKGLGLKESCPKDYIYLNNVEDSLDSSP